MMIEQGTYLFAGWNEDAARAYIHDKGFTPELVKMARGKDGGVYVIARKDCEWPKKNQTL